MAKRHLGLTLFFIFTLGISTAHAIPALQIYLPGGEYDASTQSWVTDNPSFRLDVVGAQVKIEDVKIALVVPTNENGTITVSRWANGPIGAPFILEEVSPLAANPAYYAMDSGNRAFGDYYFVTSGTPQKGNGSSVANGALASGINFPSSYYQFYLGNFGLGMDVYNHGPLDSDDDGTAKRGHIESLYVVGNGYTSVDIIGYNHIIGSGSNSKYAKTPGSHDGGYAVPEPGTLVLLGLGLVGLFAVQRRRKHLS